MSESANPNSESAPVRTRTTWVRYQVLAALCLAAAIAYTGRSCLGVAADVVRAELGLSLPQMATAMSAFFWGYALAQIPAGWLGQRIGPRHALSLYATLWSLCCRGFTLTSGFFSLILIQAIFGVAQAGIFPCSAAILANWLPTSRRALASGLLGSFMSLGGALGSFLTGLAISGFAWGSLDVSPILWQSVFLLFALPGLLWAACFRYWFRDDPRSHRGVNPAELSCINGKQQASSTPTAPPLGRIDWLTVLGRLDIWMLFSQQFFRAAGYIFFATWFPTYLKETRGVSTAMSGVLTALPLLAVVVGGMCGGIWIDFLYNRTGNLRISRQLTPIFSLASCAVCIFLAYFISDAKSAVLLISCGIFVAQLGGPSAYVVMIEKAGPNTAPLFGAMNMAGNLGAAICPSVVGGLVAWSDNWNLVLFLFAGIYLAASICWVFLDPRGTFTDGVPHQSIEA